MSIIIFIILSAILHLRIFLVKTQLAYGDFSPFPESANQAFSYFFNTWHESGFGIFRHPGHIQTLIQGVLLYFTGNPVLAQKIYIFLIPIISFITFTYAIRIFFPKKHDRFSAFIAATFYAYSPIFILEFLGGTLYSTMVGFAFFPLLYAKTHLVIKNGKKQDVLYLGILLGMIISINPHMVVIYALSLIVPFITNSFCFSKRALYNFCYFPVVFILGFLVNPIFILNSLNLVSSTTSSGEVSSFAKSFGMFIGDIKYTYQWTTMTTILRAGNNFSAIDYTKNNWWTVPIYMIFPFVFRAIVQISNNLEKNEERKIFVELLFGFIFFSSILFLIHGGHLFFIFKSFPVLFLFRNPAKLTFLLTFFLTFLVYIAFESIQSIYFSSLWKKHVLTILLAVCVLLYMLPIFSLDRGLSKARVSYTIPEEYSKTSSKLHKQSTQPLTHNLWLPASYEDTTIKLVWLDETKIEAQLGLNQFTDDYYTDGITNAINSLIINNRPLEMKKLLEILRIENIVIRKDTRGTLETSSFYQTNYLIGGSKGISSFFSFLPKIFEDDSIIVYKNKDVYPFFYSPFTVYKTIDTFKNAVSILPGSPKDTYPALFLFTTNTSDIEFHQSNSKTQIDFKKNSAVSYTVHVTQGLEEVPLISSIGYDPDWIIIEAGERTHNSHFVANGYANAWILNTKEICEKVVCTTNADGSANYTIHIHFKQQENLHISLLISIMTLCISIGAIISLSKHEKN